MRTKSMSTFLALALLAVTAAPALAIYTPNPAGRWEENRFFFAADLQYNGDKDLDSGGSIDDEVGFFVRPSYAFARNATLYGRIGFQDADHIDTEFAIGAGVQAAWEIPQAKDWAVGGSIDYLYWDLDHADYHEVQFAPAVSYNIPQLREVTPYAGFVADFLVDDLEEDDPVGLLLGSNFDLNENIRFDAQIRLIAENGFFLSAGYRF
jgi:opacity protein-like surface antigen